MSEHDHDMPNACNTRWQEHVCYKRGNHGLGESTPTHRCQCGAASTNQSDAKEGQ